MFLSSWFQRLRPPSRGSRRRAHPSPAARRCRPGVEALENRRLLTTLFGVFANTGVPRNQSLVSFDSSAPGAYTGSTSITGLQPNEQILTIDFRPRTGQLYGLGSTLPDAVGKHASSRIYTIDPLTGAASAVAAAFAVPLDGFAFGFSFNPVTDQIRVVSDHGQNLRVDPDSGAVVVDPALAFTPGDPSQAERPPMIAAAAYTNHAASAATTTLFDYSAQGPDLVRQGSPGGSPLSPDSGQLFTVARTAVFSLNFVGFSIPPGSGSGFFCGSQFGPSSFDSELYTVDLTTGATRNLGTIANGAEPVTGIAVSPGGNAQSLANQRFVGQVYRDLLGREADPSGLAAWTSALDQGAGRAQVVLGIEGSAEYQGDVVEQLYGRFLHRSADAGGFRSAVAFLQAGGTDEQLAAFLAGSAEYFQTRGGTNDAFLNAFYQDALGRQPDSGGRAFFDQQLASGLSRVQVAAAILEGDEYRQDLVRSAYQRFLRRAADAGGLQAFANYLAEGGRDEVVIAALVGSQEYFARL